MVHKKTLLNLINEFGKELFALLMFFFKLKSISRIIKWPGQGVTGIGVLGFPKIEIERKPHRSF